jgi:hypothetical protein
MIIFHYAEFSKGKLELVHFQNASAFKALSAFMALYFIHGALFHSWHFISFMALYFIHCALFHSWRFISFVALLFFLHSAFCSCIALYSNVLSVNQRLFIFSKCESARYLFLPPNHHAAIILIS